MQNLIFNLCSCVGVSGNELNMAQVAIGELEKYAEVKTDHNGNIIATMGKLSSKKHILLDAHMDQIGLIATYINDDGFVKIAPCGGLDRRVMLGSTIKTVTDDPIYGVICCLPPHLSDGGEDKAAPVDTLYVDFGMSKNDVEKFISLGDNLVIHSEPKLLLNNKVAAPALDNRAGVASLIRCAELIHGADIDCKVSILLSSQEETGALGAATAAYTLNPDEAIAVDVSFASQPSVPNEKSGKFGSGPMIGVAPNLSNEVTNTLINLAKSNGITHQFEIMSSSTGTNIDKICVTRQGIKSGLLSIPQRYMHTPVEVVCIDDIEQTAQLLAKYILNGGINNG